MTRESKIRLWSEYYKFIRKGILERIDQQGGAIHADTKLLQLDVVLRRVISRIEAEASRQETEVGGGEYYLTTDPKDLREIESNIIVESESRGSDSVSQQGLGKP